MSNPYLRVSKVYLRRYFKYDFTAAIIVFLVAVPLCLGIALASGAPIYSGMISGIIGGIIVGFLSPSSVSVSGPAAGMAAVVVAALGQLNDFNTVLLALFISGCLQILAGWRGAGFFADYFPSSVIKGMLSAIGLLLIFKQLPLAFTLSKNLTELKFHLLEAEGSYIHPFINLSFHINSGALFLSLLSLASLIYFDKSKHSYLKNLPSAIIVVLLGTLLNEWFVSQHSILAQHGPHLVNIPSAYSFKQFIGSLASPNWQAWNNPMVHLYALIFACVTSLETLLNITATEKIDKKHRQIDKNKEPKVLEIC